MSAFLRVASRIAARPTARAFSSTPSRPVARITIIGNLADTPELKATSTGTEILRYAVASNRGTADNRQTDWFNIVSFEPEGPRRDFLQSLPKGSLVCVEGDASMNTFEDGDGKTRTALNIRQRSIDVLRRPASATQ
ncbi:single-strand binding protein family [Bombardia bombarda]|uniref:Single-strand binding protein family n=1 Tax=Bombardia bombarda TaxID=252184 RepID=A0AA40C1A7_9PEZI|nr:single-strand binding protein family [Bombardia bombarda]